MTSTDPIEPTEGYLTVPGGRLHFLDWGGAGHPAHFLHGNGFCAGTYAPFIRQLAGMLHITASDIRGHSGSEFETLERIRNWRVFAEDLKLLIRGTQTPPVIGMGHSLGAVATTIAAASYPDLFKAIILIDPVFLPPRTLWKAAGMRLLGLARAWPRAVRARKRRRVFNGKADAFRYFVARGIFKSWSPEFVQAYLECGLLEKDEQTAVLRCDPELEAQIFESVPLDVWSQCRKISCPVLAVRGEQSDVFLKEAAVRLGAHGGRLRGRHHPGVRPFPDHGKTAAVRGGDQGLRVAAAACLKVRTVVSPPPAGCLPAARRTRRPFRRG